MNRERLLVWLLRFAGAVEILAFISVVMPRYWMEVSHEWLGMGTMPDGPLVMFMIRQASYAYGMHGISMWILASDVARFRPLIVFTGVAFLLAAPVFFLIDYTTGVPFWWTIFDSLACGSIGIALLLLTRGIGQSNSAKFDNSWIASSQP